MKNFSDLTFPELEIFCKEIGLPRFRARQMWRWVYHKGARDFSVMTDLAPSLRDVLSPCLDLSRPSIAQAQCSTDGTQKWLLKFTDGREAETVHIPTVDRGTLCVSSQVGCTLTCKFCHTGTQTWVRNLQTHEIVGQALLAKDLLSDWSGGNARRQLTNVVFMGMGEPLYNYDNVARALHILMDPEGLGLSKRKITLSTSGIVPFIDRCGAETGVSLAVSLHAVRDDLRDILVPINKNYPIQELMNSCRRYPGLDKGRRITFEYVMLKDVNDTDADARALVKLIQGIPSKINLIPFNPWPGTIYECSSGNRIRSFAEILLSAGYPAPIRETRGQDILAACGQLKSESERVRKSLLGG